MRFLHCGDLHIGAGRGDGREGDFAAAFLEVAELAVNRNVDLVLIAGDLFDRREINPQALGQASQSLGILRKAGIPVYAIEGNHDKALYVDRESWMDYLDREGLLYLLRRPEGESLYLPYQEGGNVAFCGETRILGLPYAGTRTRELVERLTEEIPLYKGVTIAMLHCPVGSQMAMDNAYLPSQVVEALGEKVDYIALGHIHTAYHHLDLAYNPGAPESVRMEEGIGGEKGVYLGEIGPGGRRVELIPIRRRTAVRGEALLTTAMDVPEAETAIRDALTRAVQGPGALVSLGIRGQVAFDPVQLDLEGVRAYGRELEVKALDIQLRLQSLDSMGSVSMDMEELEREVLSVLWREKGRQEEAHLVEMTLQIKERILGDRDAYAEIAQDIERLTMEKGERQ
jgi:exonuclease SbcD